MSQDIEKYCGSCGSLINNAEYKFCGECGAAFSSQPLLNSLPPPQERPIEANSWAEVDNSPSRHKSSNNYFSNAALGLAVLGVSLSGFISFGAVPVALISKSKGEKRANLALGFSILSVIVSVSFGALYFSSSPTGAKFESKPKTEIYLKGYVIGQNFSKVSLAQTTADEACSTARDRNFVLVSGIPRYINDGGKVNSILSKSDGFTGCLEGFKNPYASPPTVSTN